MYIIHAAVMNARSKIEISEVSTLSDKNRVIEQQVNVFSPANQSNPLMIDLNRLHFSFNFHVIILTRHYFSLSHHWNNISWNRVNMNSVSHP